MISINNLTKSFNAGENSSLILSDLSLLFEKDKIYSVLGPSGCGKTTLLNIIGELIAPNFGEVKINSPHNIGYMLQENMMLPWRTLKENVLLGYEIYNNSKTPINSKIDGYIKEFELDGYANYYPSTLSGGMKQRAALIRTLLIQPNIILLDEPFSNLDYDIKLKVQNILLDYFHKNACTIILVTHDIEDVIALSDKIIILSEKPSKVKKEIVVDLGIESKNPIEARLSSKFNFYFKEIWEELKYLE